MAAQRIQALQQMNTAIAAWLSPVASGLDPQSYRGERNGRASAGADRSL